MQSIFPAGAVVAYPANYNYQSRAEQYGPSEELDISLQTGVEQNGENNVNVQDRVQQYQRDERRCPLWILPIAINTRNFLLIQESK